MKYYLFIVSIAFMISCDPDQDVNLTETEELIEEKISTLLAEIDPAPTYSYSRENQEIPLCKLIKSRFTASYETPEVVRIFSYRGAKLSKVETFDDGNYTDTKYVVTEGNVVKVLSDDSIVIDKYIYENGLLSEYSLYQHGELWLKGKFFYSNKLPNRLLIVNNLNQISVIDILSDKYGNILEERVIWIEDQLPSTNYLYEFSYDDKIQPYYNLPSYWGNRDLNSINNEIEFKAYVDGILQSDNDQLTLEYDTNGFLTKRVEQSGYTHTLEYTYECE